MALQFEAGRGTVIRLVEAVRVHHEPVHEAVAHRITTPAGVMVVSGDTRVCDEVVAHLTAPPASLSRGVGTRKGWG